jgi:hypothetical protein
MSSSSPIYIGLISIVHWCRLYPVDKTRVNEFGESFEPTKKSNESKKKR